ncbi:hypothetical protein EMIHUDRAFT_455896 [Emiliania huxleyi CCMP1516]|uniref:TLDc domain-containing protein n=2 Tax=Emiliania huxleyi TaxID=2903 RepID=A0A0D3KBD5_EMIH1|nr:hypothetical protein EMIHUDRAFT_455896 [Emiliania huxleyi CCMP1516]EOD33070.1 hypothetical protein EMIHUDRAFT_455896 [Emiliania huxleyi CCMP1516]|eukprot:XP_005785499.1 hypothetical protein EMIHUDRAFT_455896 [Emiliania huxleyi CCMP1516]
MSSYVFYENLPDGVHDVLLGPQNGLYLTGYDSRRRITFVLYAPPFGQRLRYISQLPYRDYGQFAPTVLGAHEESRGTLLILLYQRPISWGSESMALYRVSPEDGSQTLLSSTPSPFWPPTALLPRSDGSVLVATSGSGPLLRYDGCNATAGGRVVGGDRRIPSYGGDYRYAREDKGVEVQLLLFESFGGFGKGVREILRKAADVLQNKLTRAQYLDEVTWTTKSWLGLQKQRISVVLHTAIAEHVVNELACGGGGRVHTELKSTHAVMMKLYLAIVASLLTPAQSNGKPWPDIAGYTPGSDVIKHANLDLDQQALEEALGESTPNFDLAEDWYAVGGNSLSGKAPSGLRTMKGFSTSAEGKMYNDCVGCPYKTFSAFYDYEDFDFADKWVSAALVGTNMAFSSGRHGPYDFATLGDTARIEAVKKGTAYMNVWMYVIRDCEHCPDGENCNEFSDSDLDPNTALYKPVHSFDEGVAFYAGSLEGPNVSGSSAGKTVYLLAEKRYANFDTCESGSTGLSNVNKGLLAEFIAGEAYLMDGNCSAVRPIVDTIIKQMVPLRYAYKVGSDPVYDDVGTGRSQKNAAEGAVFTAAVLPLVHECNVAAAKIISDEMKFGLYDQGEYPDFAAVKAAFESTYDCLGITCADVGGLSPGGVAAACNETSLVVSVKTQNGFFSIGDDIGALNATGNGPKGFVPNFIFGGPSGGGGKVPPGLAKLWGQKGGALDGAGSSATDDDLACLEKIVSTAVPYAKPGMTGKELRDSSGISVLLLLATLENVEYVAVGYTATGAPYFRDTSSLYYVYWDPVCNSNGFSASWIVDDEAPSITESIDLDEDGKCVFLAYIKSGDSSSPPLGTNSWYAWCGGSWTNYDLVIAAWGADAQFATLCYSTADHGFSASTFHSRCDRRGASVTIWRYENGVIAGGYSSASWASPYSCGWWATCGYYGAYSSSSTAFLFSISKNHKHSIRNPSYAIDNDRDYGPKFGNGDFYLSSNMRTGYCRLGNAYECRVGTAGSAECADDFTGGGAGTARWASVTIWRYENGVIAGGGGRVVGGDRRIPSYGGDYRYAREDKGVEVQLLLFESFGGFGKGVREILRKAADVLQNKLTRAQYLDEVTWTTKSWLGLQKQRISVVLHTAIAEHVVNELACGGGGRVHTELNAQFATLCYSTADHGFSASTFHSRCDGRGASVSIWRYDNGVIAGGYSSVSWTSNYYGAYSSSSTAFLFSISKNHKHSIRNPSYAIYNHRYYDGPTFGNGDFSLSSNMRTGSCSLGSAYECRAGTAGSAECADDFTGGGASSWQIDQLEVWVGAWVVTRGVVAASDAVAGGALRGSACVDVSEWEGGCDNLNSRKDSCWKSHDGVSPCVYSDKVGMSTRRRRALTAVDFNTVEFAVIESFASGDPAVIITAEQLILEDLGDSKLQVTIVQVTVRHAADGPTAEAITAAANKTAFLKRVAEELEAEVAFGVLPSTVVVVVTTIASPSYVWDDDLRT